MKCNQCGSKNTVKSGHVTHLNKGRHKVVYQIYKCKNCGGNTCDRIRG